MDTAPIDGYFFNHNSTTVLFFALFGQTGCDGNCSAEACDNGGSETTALELFGNEFSALLRQVEVDFALDTVIRKAKEEDVLTCVFEISDETDDPVEIEPRLIIQLFAAFAKSES